MKNLLLMPLKTVKCGQYGLVGSAWSVVQWPWTALVRKWNQAGGMQIQYGPASHAGPYASNWSAVSWFMWDYDRSQYEGPGTDGPHTSIQSPFWKKKFTLSLSNSLSMTLVCSCWSFNSVSRALKSQIPRNSKDRTAGNTIVVCWEHSTEVAVRGDLL